MAKLSTKGFVDSVGTGSGKFSKWKEKGKTIGWVHPRIGIHERLTHGIIPSEEKDNDGKTQIRNRRFNCSGKNCLVCALIDFAEEQVSKYKRDEDELILNGGKTKFTLGQLAGRGDWKTDLSPRKEYLIAWVPRDNRDDSNPVEILTATEGLGYAIKRVIESRIDDYGEKKGDFMRNPYALKLIYKKEEVPMRKYDAEYVSNDLAKIDEDVNEVFGADEDDLGFDIESLTKPPERKKVLETIGSCWDNRRVTFDDFLGYIGEEMESNGEDEEDKFDEMDRKELKRFIKSNDLDIVIKKSMSDDDIRDLIRENYEEEEGEESEEEEGEEDKFDEMDRKELKRYIKREELDIVVKKSMSDDDIRDLIRDHINSSKKKNEGKKKSKKASTHCDDCGEDVIPTKFGKCPNCAARLDIPF